MTIFISRSSTLKDHTFCWLKYSLSSMIAFVVLTAAAFGQVDRPTLAKIIRAEDGRRYDSELQALLSSPNERVRVRATLAAGRIGDDKAVPDIVPILASSGSAELKAMAAFALGEIESATASEAILKVLSDQTVSPIVRSRAVEAAGKIAAANAPRANKEKPADIRRLDEAILDVLESEQEKAEKQDRQTVLLALTAALRASPEDASIVVARFLTNLDARVRADAANTLARLRAKNANDALRAMLLSDSDAIARANAARALGGAEDRSAFDLLLAAAVEDIDVRVRVSAVRSVGTLRDAKAIDKLLDHGEALLSAARKSKQVRPAELGELLEIATVIGRLAAGTNDGRSLRFLATLRAVDRFRSGATETAFARVSPDKFLSEANASILGSTEPWIASAFAAAIESMSAATDDTTKAKALAALKRYFAASNIDFAKGRYGRSAQMMAAIPDLLRAYAAFKPSDLDVDLRRLLTSDDVFVRATAADLLGDRPASPESIKALTTAFQRSLETDKTYNDAQLSIMDSLAKLNKKAVFEVLRNAFSYSDFLVRKKAFDLLNDDENWKDIPRADVIRMKEFAVSDLRRVWPYDPKTGTKLGQALSTDADYRRAAARKNGSVRAILTTSKGTFSIDLLPEDAPLTVDNFIKLAMANYFNGVLVHRVVPNFVVQDGDPRGDGNGGPGWSIRCEINMVPYDRGAVGMALSGKDTGGSQWFVTHSPQPHLDGGYTVFGRVNERGMKVIDEIVRGDKILSVRISETARPRAAKK